MFLDFLLCLILSNYQRSHEQHTKAFTCRMLVLLRKESQTIFLFNYNLYLYFIVLFSSRFVSVHVVHPYSSIDVTAAWKKLHFILSIRSDFHIIDSLLIAVHAFVNLVSMSFSVDSTLLPR